MNGTIAQNDILLSTCVAFYAAQQQFCMKEGRVYHAVFFFLNKLLKSVHNIYVRIANGSRADWSVKQNAFLIHYRVVHSSAEIEAKQ